MSRSTLPKTSLIERYEEHLPERALIRSMLKQALMDYLFPTKDRDSQVAHRSAAAWLFEEPTEPLRPFSFSWVCENLYPHPESNLRDTFLARIQWLKSNPDFLCWCSGHFTLKRSQGLANVVIKREELRVNLALANTDHI